MSLMEDLILATDVNKHKDFLAKFETMLSIENGIDLNNTYDRQFALMVSTCAYTQCMHLCTYLQCTVYVLMCVYPYTCIMYVHVLIE